MQKDLYYANLYSLYGGLLSSQTSDVTDMYYLLDLSLSEIADQKGVTRQSVADALKKARAKLDKFENALGLYALRKNLFEFSETLGEEEKKKLTAILEK